MEYRSKNDDISSRRGATNNSRIDKPAPAKHLSALTGIRFIAAFYVFLFHMNLRVPFTFLYSKLVNIIGQGTIGVNIFFVLSGFILTANYFQKPLKYKDFIIKRFIRIYPAYLVGLILSLPLYYPGKFVVGLNLLMIESYFPNYAMLWYGGGAWSISTEFFFYALFPLLLPFFLSKPKKQLLAFLPFFFVVGALPGILLNVYHFQVQISYCFPPSRLCEFICGIIGGTLAFKYGVRIKEWLALAATVVLALYLAFFGWKYEGWTIHNFLVIPAVLLVLIACIQAEETKFLKWLGTPLMEYLGKISYAFYIIELPLLAAFEGLLNKHVLSPTNLYQIPAMLVINLLLSIVLYEYIEVPAQKFFQKITKKKVGVNVV